MLFREVITLETEKNKYYDITDKIIEIVNKCQVEEGFCNIFVPATTAGFIINENDRMLIEDFRMLLDKIAPEDKSYSHQSNAFSHLRAAITRNETTIPISKGELVLGTWQSIMFWEFDVNPRTRKVIITVSGD